MVDEIAFADEVSALLKGKYADLPKGERGAAFDRAFNEIANAWHIRGESRSTLKSSVGKILAKRPRKKVGGTRTAKNVQALPSFEVVESDEHTYVIFETKELSPSRFRFIPDGWTIRPNNVSEVLMNRAREFAKTFFAKCAEKSTRETSAHIVKLEASATHLSLVLDGLFEISFVEGKKGVCASVTKLRTPCKQKDVPRELLREARGIATTYFKGNRTLPLQFT